MITISTGPQELSSSVLIHNGPRLAASAKGHSAQATARAVSTLDGALHCPVPGHASTL
jgi:hypothetical protein